MSKSTDEVTQYGVRHADGSITWGCIPEEPGRFPAVDALDRNSNDVVHRTRVTIAERGTWSPAEVIRRLNRTAQEYATAEEQRLHLPAGTIIPEVIVQRSITRIFDDPTEA